MPSRPGSLLTQTDVVTRRSEWWTWQMAPVSAHRCAAAVNLSRMTLVNICPPSRYKAAAAPWSASGQRRRRVVNGLVDEFLVQLHGCIPVLTTGCRCSLFVPPRGGSCEFRTMRGT